MCWVKNPQGQTVYWLNGLAGTGKSTIAQSFSEMVSKEGILGASFFCSRDYLNRQELKKIFPTLAHQLACNYSHLQTHIINMIKQDPTIAHTSLISQLENLLINPLSRERVSCVIIIDALDECIDDQPSSAILSVLGQFTRQLPLVKFFITGRPEPRIRAGFRLPLLEPLTQIFLLHQVESSSVDKDIHLYLMKRLSKIAKERSDVDLPNPWPHENDINVLTKKSSGLFIFASTLVRFIGSEHHGPSERLQLVVSEANSTILEGHAGIDSLYSQILLHAFSDISEAEVFDNMRRVLGAIVLAFNPLSRRELSTILGLSTTLISTTLRHLHSVILVPSDELKEIRVFHKSFPDFLQDHTRCTDPRFHVDPPTYHANMVLRCLKLVKKLKVNPCHLPPFIMNQDMFDLPQLLEKGLGSATQYACSYWARHLKLSPTSDGCKLPWKQPPTTGDPRSYRGFGNNFSQQSGGLKAFQQPGYFVDKVNNMATKVLKISPTWIEAMSLGNNLGEVIHSMHSLLYWLDKVSNSILQMRRGFAYQ